MEDGVDLVLPQHPADRKEAAEEEWPSRSEYIILRFPIGRWSHDDDDDACRTSLSAHFDIKLPSTPFCPSCHSSWRRRTLALVGLAPYQNVMLLLCQRKLNAKEKINVLKENGEFRVVKDKCIHHPVAPISYGQTANTLPFWFQQMDLDFRMFSATMYPI